MRIFNTLTRKVEEFIPHEKGKVKMYTCGPTVYHYAHIGNLRTYISEDLLEKSLNYLGYEVTRCMNITDVGHLVSDGDTGEDKMLVAAQREHKTSMEIAEYYTNCFYSDMEKLNIDKPKIISKATDNINEYIKIIDNLMKKDIAYLCDGNVYFDTSKFKNYYELSGRNEEDLIIASREGIEEDKAKRNPFDFGLWFTNSKFDNQELQWDSPWGRGYPGWHIECSGIAIKYLGEFLDIHCGAEDAVFPHHTNEIAQSEAYLDHKWCKYWIHYGFLNDEEGKMSKSKGDFLTVSLLIEKGYNPLSYRYLCINSKYHNQLTFSYDILNGAENAYKKLKQKTLSLNEDGELDNDVYNKYNELFKDALKDDMNTSLALTIVYDVLKSDANNATKIKLIKDFDTVLSLDLFKDDKKEVANELLEYINNKIRERNTAKENKDFILADSIREELLNKGIIIKDTREGTIYEIK